MGLSSFKVPFRVRFGLLRTFGGTAGEKLLSVPRIGCVTELGMASLLCALEETVGLTVWLPVKVLLSANVEKPMFTLTNKRLQIFLRTGKKSWPRGYVQQTDIKPCDFVFTTVRVVQQ